MTPLPKKKHSKSRTKIRKATISLSLPQLVVCPKCKNLKFPHHVCPNCGYYSNKTSNSKAEIKQEKSSGRSVQQ